MAGSSARLVLICGLPASGKSTLARRLATEMPAVRLNKDDWVIELGGDLWDDALRVRVERQLWSLTQELLDHGVSVILEWGHWARAERDEKRLGARTLGVGVELHVLDAPIDELLARSDRRTLAGDWVQAPITRAHFEAWVTRFERPDDDELSLFDSPEPVG
ncbi:MAG TPA: ATP-binding protein [Acidimicrobiales bacterium]|nr:ATP-binding protein [Acidimicrobiales bacterium]